MSRRSTPTAASELSAPAAGATLALPPVRVLVVDDNYDSATSLAIVLGRLGAEVSVAHDGPGAIDAYASFKPAIVLLDIGLPGMDGYAVARELRERDPGRRTTLVALTGWGQDDDRARAREAGFEHHLVKPAEIEAVQRLITEAGRRTRPSLDT